MRQAPSRSVRWIIRSEPIPGDGGLLIGAVEVIVLREPSTAHRKCVGNRCVHLLMRRSSEARTEVSGRRMTEGASEARGGVADAGRVVRRGASEARASSARVSFVMFARHDSTPLAP